MSILTRAAETLDKVRPGLSRAQRQMLLGHVYAESNFGYAKNFQLPNGDTSNNWGALYAKGDKGSIPVGDTYEGKPVTMQAAWNSTMEAGARQYVNLISGSYDPAIRVAADGNAWNFARILWRDGPGSKRPPYYTGFPPGHKWSLAPAGTKVGTGTDQYYRVLAYAKFVSGGAAQVAKALGEPLSVRVDAPPPPAKGGRSSEGAGGVIGALGLVVGAVLIARS